MVLPVPNLTLADNYVDLVKREWPTDMRLNPCWIFNAYTTCCGCKKWAFTRDYLPTNTTQIYLCFRTVAKKQDYWTNLLCGKTRFLKSLIW
jgi:hypothetical protein